MGAGRAGGDAGGAGLDGGGDVSGAGSLAGGEAGGAGSLAGGHAGGAVGLAGGAAEMGPIAIPGLSTGGGLLAAKIVAGLAVLGAVGAGVVFQNRAPEKPTVVTSAQVRESGPEVRGPGEGVTGESATGRRAQGAQEAASGQAPGQRAGAGSVAENGAEHGALGADQGQGQGAVTVGTPEPGAAGVRGGSEGASLAAPGGTLRGAPASSGASPAAGETPAEEGSTEEGSTLKDEVEHLATLRELSRTDPARAAAMALEGHSRFRKGVFWQEREVLMIHALASSGRSAEARSRGEAFLARHPESPFAETLRRTLGITP